MADRKQPELSHIAPDGSARMVDVGDKADTEREAIAAGEVRIAPEALKLVRAGKTAKGNVRETARLAGILAAKKTSELIPLCHPLALDHIDINIKDMENGLAIEARVRSRGRTGVEMEALTAVSVAALTIYDMVKAADKTMVIENVRLLRKQGGKSGLYQRDE
jgi:cyclic pyranopterin phosphate synthase